MRMTPDRLARLAALPFAIAMLSACSAATTPPVAPPTQAGWAALGQEVYVDGPHVTPLKVIEDSRCPKDAQCVWAGRVVVRVRVGKIGAKTIGAGERDVVLHEPFAVADGHMTLAEVTPAPVVDRTANGSGDPAAYRFRFTFAGGY